MDEKKKKDNLALQPVKNISNIDPVLDGKIGESEIAVDEDNNQEKYNDSENNTDEAFNAHQICPLHLHNSFF
jgi:hypothetical protein